MTKLTINTEWEKYIKNEIKRGISKEKLEDILIKQNYHKSVINKLLNDVESIIVLDDLESKTLNKDPLVKVFDNFLTDEESSHFINICKTELKRSEVSGKDGGMISNGRTGYNTWLQHNYDNITKRVSQKIAKIVNLPVENAEAFQFIYYDKAQEYRNHYDSWDHDNSDKTLRCMKYGGARLVTALCYLNDVKKGGGTKMTKLNITVEPIKNRLLIFQNTINYNNHNKHPLSEHAGLPVEEGEKYAFNLWFKECNSKKLYKNFNPNYYIIYI